MSLASDPALRESLAALLQWYEQIGVTFTLDEAAHDRFADFASPPPPPPVQAELPPAKPKSAPRATPALLTADAAQIALSAREAAGSATTLAELRAALAAFEGCPLRITATNLVFSDGNPEAPVMFVGEAPGAEEDQTGRPFVGRAGQLLDRMLGAIGLDRTRAYIANVVPWRPPGNRTPTPLEVAACLPFTLRQIELVAPRWLVTLGAAATQTLTGSKDPIGKMRGRWTEIEAGALRVKALPMLHPAFLLRTPAQKRAAWTDLRRLRRVMDEAGA